MIEEYPDWVCADCGKRFGNRKDSGIATWHINECGICGMYKPVTEPRDFGHLRAGWVNKALETFALDVVKAASAGDQTFVPFLGGADPDMGRLRLALVSLNEILKRF
jgi:hypothetical protein